MILGAVASLFGAAAWLVLTPYGPENEVFVDLAPGSSTVKIGRKLEAAGVVRSRYAFDVLRLFKRGKLHAGEYRFEGPVTVSEVYGQILRGEIYARVLVVPEGANLFDIANRVEQAQLATREDFLAACRQTDLIADLDPGARNLEGYLFPDTYKFPHSITAGQIASTMVHRFRLAAARVGLNKNVHATVTLASLIERETAVESDRPLIASVFVNRLAKKMPLATDPAVIYGLELQGRWRGQLAHNELTTDTPYNTYMHAGLPPGPIANPGIRSLRAALNPDQTNYLYFVAAGTNAQGHSRFAATLDEHNRNVADYRRAMKKAGLR